MLARTAVAWLARALAVDAPSSPAPAAGSLFARSLAKAAGGAADSASPAEDRKAANRTALLVKVSEQS